MQISQFQKFIADKYLDVDKKRGTAKTFMWFVEEIGELATALATDNDAETKQEAFADCLAWLCTLANINDVDLEKACEKYTKGDIKGFK